MKGRPTQKTTHQNKNSLHKQFAQTISGQFVQTVPLFPLIRGPQMGGQIPHLRPFPFKISRKQIKTVCANCLRKLFSFGWVVFLGGSPSLDLGLQQARHLTNHKSHTHTHTLARPHAIRRQEQCHNECHGLLCGGGHKIEVRQVVLDLGSARTHSHAIERSVLETEIDEVWPRPIFRVRENTLYPPHDQNHNHGFSFWFQFPFFCRFPRKEGLWFREKWV